MFDMSGLARLRKGKSRSINWENRTGEKGKGGMAAGDLGPSRKGSPCIPHVKAGEQITLAQMEGPGVIGANVLLKILRKTFIVKTPHFYR